MASSPVPIGEVFADKYRVDRILGEGGMGVVVLAHHLELDQPVAVKFLLDDVATNEEGAERFRREARAAAKIQSDHVVRVLDVGVLESGERYMVMEYMEGRDLAEEIAERRTFPIGVAAGIILEALDAVGHAHAVGIVHRDLKPANLYLAERPDGSQRVKVLDFGISKSIGSATTEEMSLTKTSAWIGSPLYMAPEQMRSARDVDHRADIWSLGAILYELIAGRPPYEADSLPQLCNLLITTDPEPIQNLVPSIPDGLAAAIMKCLVRDREHRMSSTREFGRALVNYASSITGSELRKSLVDQAEFQASLPGPQLAGGFSTAEPEAAQTMTSAVEMSGSTHAAWGATDGGDRKKSSGKTGLLFVALAAAAAVGLFFWYGSMGSAEEVIAASGPSSEGEDVRDLLPEGPSEAPAEVAEKAAPEAPKVGSKGSEEDVAPSKETTEDEAAVAPVPAPVVAPRPVKAPQPRPAARPKSPAPAPKPAPQTKDDFADFGGRR